MPTETEEKEIVEIHLDPNLKALWVDTIHIAKREDDLSCVRLSASLPDGLFEQSKFIISTNSLKDFVDLICSAIDYFPKKKTIKKNNPFTPVSQSK